MWGAASFLFRCARCSGTPVWVRGSRSSRRSPYRIAVPSGGGGRPPGPGGAEGRACGSPAGVGPGGGFGLVWVKACAGRPGPWSALAFVPTRLG